MMTKTEGHSYEQNTGLLYQSGSSVTLCSSGAMPYCVNGCGAVSADRSYSRLRTSFCMRGVIFTLVGIFQVHLWVQATIALT